MTASIEWIAHRGASYDAPENTLAAVALAWQQDTDAVEIDCRLTADKQIVVIHDEDTLRTAGRRVLVADASLETLRQLDVGRFRGATWIDERIPTLPEAIQTVKHGKRLLVEVKCGVEIADALVSVLDRSSADREVAAVISYHLDVLRAVKKQRPTTTAYLVARFEPDRQPAGTAPPTIAQLISSACDAQLDGLNLHVGGPLDAAALANIHQAGLSCYVWTTDDPSEARRMIELGVDGIATNRPAWLRQQVGC
jgi:glycerophosphoryl diester phosphodiesterase